MMRLLQKLLLKSGRIRQAVIDRNERLKDQRQRQRWAEFFEAGGTIR
jgi:hypothetical protein